MRGNVPYSFDHLLQKPIPLRLDISRHQVDAAFYILSDNIVRIGGPDNGNWSHPMSDRKKLAFHVFQTELA